MNALLIVVNDYQRKVSRCIEVANEIISEQVSINGRLDAYNLHMASLKTSALLLSRSQLDSPDLSDGLLSLDQSASALHTAVDVARLAALGRLGLAFDDLRSAAENLNSLLPGDVECLIPTLRKCQKDISDVCDKLIEHCVVDATSLRVMGVC